MGMETGENLVPQPEGIEPEKPKRGRRRRVIVPLTAEGAEAEGKKARELKRIARIKAHTNAVVTSSITAEDWEYIIKRAEGNQPMSAVMQLADTHGETLTRSEAMHKSQLLEKRLGPHIDAQVRGKVMSDEDFEAWARMKVEQLAATPTPNAQGVLRAIQWLKKAREEGKARNPVALMKQVMESGERLYELDVLEGIAIQRGLMAPTDGEHGSQ